MARPLDERVAVHVEGRAPADADPAALTNGTTTIGRLADELLPLLISRLDASSLGELEVRHDGWRVRLRRRRNANDEPTGGHGRRSRGADRSSSRTDRSAETAGASAGGTGRAGGPGAVAATGVGGPANIDSQRPATDRTIVTSPAVGYYQPRDELSIGASVRAGDLLGHVDVLGVPQDVVVTVDGRLSRLLAEAGEAVEYGQPLARLEPESRH